MSRLQGHSLDWAGDMVQSPHGDWFHRKDVERLQDELEAIQGRLKVATQARLDLESEIATKATVEPLGHDGKSYRLFGWVAPHDARQFNSGKTAYCKVFKKRTPLFCMPLSNCLGPNHYQKPPICTVVKIFDGQEVEVRGHVPEGLTVAAGGIEFNVTKWSWTR